MKRPLLALACWCFCIYSTGCQPQPPVEDPAAAVSPAVAPQPIETAPVAAIAEQPSPLDPRAFAGTFANATTSVRLGADGSADFSDAGASFDGTWTSEDGGTRIRVDPNSKAEPDRLYAVAGGDEIRPADADGKPIGSGESLRRTVPVR